MFNWSHNQPGGRNKQSRQDDPAHGWRGTEAVGYAARECHADRFHFGLTDPEAFGKTKLLVRYRIVLFEMKQNVPDDIVWFCGLQTAVYLPRQGEENRSRLYFFRNAFDLSLIHI